MEKPEQKTKETRPEKGIKEGKKEGEEEKSKYFKKEKLMEENLIRILATDIPARMKLYPGLTRIKGVSWSLSNAVCQALRIDRNKKVSELSEQEIKKIADFIKNPLLPSWLLNRRKDIETGLDKHNVTTDLDLQKDFDIRSMKKMRSYKGVRHILGQPVRGQRTRAHFRKGKEVGVQRTKVSSKK